MELDKQQIKRLRERHHRRHGIRPAHSEAMENASRFLKRAFNIREGRAPYHVIRKRFVNGARLTGSHLCILIIAMLIASIGLDIDSDIAIVGAMLICPLMGSVLAMAYGIATLDREITVEAIASLALQMVFCLVTSTLYFKLSPLGTTTAAIIDNSTPTVWDLAVALAGGFAGGLGNSRDQEPATLIAGVAVATALMPPLCAAGYGIAIASGSLFLSALYEFGINVVFIALAAEAVLLLLRVPLKRDLNGDGIVDNYDTKPIGYSDIPEIVYGFGFSLQWKAFDLSAFFQGVAHVSFSTLTDQTQAFVGRNLKESSVFADLYGNTWTPENPGAKYPRMTTGAIDNNNQLSTFWMANGRYLRLKNLELGYTLPKRIANKIAMQSLRVYLSGVNLFTFSPFKLWDPDLQTGATNYPNNRIINLGLTIGF